MLDLGGCKVFSHLEAYFNPEYAHEAHQEDAEDRLEIPAALDQVTNEKSHADQVPNKTKGCYD